MPLWPESDQTKNLLEQAKQGEETAVNRLMDRHRDSLRRLVQMRLDRKIQQRVDVSDIVQDVLVEANRRLKDYLHDGTMPFHLWLRHIARDRIIDAAALEWLPCKRKRPCAPCSIGSRMSARFRMSSTTRTCCPR